MLCAGNWRSGGKNPCLVILYSSSCSSWRCRTIQCDQEKCSFFFFFSEVSWQVTLNLYPLQFRPSMPFEESKNPGRSLQGNFLDGLRRSGRTGCYALHPLWKAGCPLQPLIPVEHGDFEQECFEQEQQKPGTRCEVDEPS